MCVYVLCIYVCMYARMYVYIYMYALVYVCVYVYIYIYVHTCIYALMCLFNLSLLPICDLGFNLSVMYYKQCNSEGKRFVLPANIVPTFQRSTFSLKTYSGCQSYVVMELPDFKPMCGPGALKVEAVKNAFYNLFAYAIQGWEYSEWKTVYSYGKDTAKEVRDVVTPLLPTVPNPKPKQLQILSYNLAVMYTASPFSSPRLTLWERQFLVSYA
jgi:hypothetical protein